MVRVMLNRHCRGGVRCANLDVAIILDLRSS